MKTQIPRKFVLALALTQGLAASLPAQTTTPATEEQAPVVLSTFTVNVDRDQGYLAVDSLSGGRQNSPIRVTPAAVSSLTKQFINDLGVTNLQDALQWSLNAIPTNFRSGNVGGNAGDTFNFWSVSIRGDSHVQGGNPPTKNYFPTFMVIDTFNIDRIEIDSGPNSILFGIGDIGGSLTSYTKLARFDKSFQDVVLLANSYGGYRATLDVNQAVNKHLAVRVNALFANEKGWRDGDFDKKKAVDLALSYRFTDNTELRFDIEGWKQERNIYSSAVQDGLALWNGSTNSPTWGAPIANIDANPLNTPGAPGIKTMGAWGGTAHYLVWSPSVGLMNWGGGARSMGTGDVVTGAYLRPESFKDGQTGATIPAIPSKEFAIAPPDSVLKPEALDMTLSFDHRLNENSEFQVAGYRYVDSAKAKNFEGAGGGNGYGVAVDLNKQLPNGQTNPNYGKRFSDFFLDAQTQDHEVNEIRGQYTYHFDTTIWNIPLKQSFSVSAGQQETIYNARQYQAQYLNGYNPDKWTETMVWARVYWDSPQGALNIPAGKDIAYLTLPFNWYDFDSKQTIKYGGLFSQTRLWDDRLSVSLGARRDKYENWKVGLRGTGNTKVISSDAGNTYSIGAVGYVTPWLGIVGNLSNNFQPAAGGLAPSLDGHTFGPSFGKGKSIGLRVSTKDGKYYASANYYNDTSTDVIGGDHPDFQGIWNQYFKAGGTNRDIGPAGVITGTGSGTNASMNYNDIYDVKYTGVEFEVVANPTKNFRVQAHYSVPKGEKENNGAQSAVYFDAHIATWKAASTGTAPENTQLATTLSDAQKVITANRVPTIAAKVPKSIANLFGTYSFTDDTLRGFEIGAGATALGQQYGNPWETANGQRTLSPSYVTYSMLVAYSRTMEIASQKVRARLQLNVDNLFDNDRLIFQNYQTFGTNGVQGQNYRYLSPRKFTLTASLSF